MTWQLTHGKARGGYLRAGASELYVRQARDGLAWLLYVDGRLEGSADGETTARAAAELAVRCMVDAGEAAVTATARDQGRAA